MQAVLLEQKERLSVDSPPQIAQNIKENSRSVNKENHPFDAKSISMTPQERKKKHSFWKIPLELRQLKQWVVWKYAPAPKGGKPKKPPYNPKTKRNADHSDPNTWATFDEAVYLYEKGGWDGIGCATCKDDGFIFIDDDRYTMDKAAHDELVNLFDSYAERSPSGKGSHIIVKGEKIFSENKLFQENDEQIEVYDTERYFTFTGEHYDGIERPIREVTPEVMQAFYDKYKKKDRTCTGGGIAQTAPQPTLFESAETVQAEPPKAIRKTTDNEVIEFCKKYTKDFDYLYNVTEEKSTDPSRDTHNLLKGLAYYAQKDFAQTEKLFRGSGLGQRVKNDAPSGGKTWLINDIEKVMSKTNGDFDPDLIKKKKAAQKQQRVEAKKSFIDGTNGQVDAGITHISIELLRNVLKSQNIAIAYDCIKKEIAFFNTETKQQNFDMTLETLGTALHDMLNMHYKNSGISTIDRYLKFISVEKTFNPVLHAIEKTVYDGSDQLSKVYECLNLSPNDDLSRTLIKKWLWQTLSLLRNTHEEPVNTAGALLLYGGQGVGKTTFLQHLGSINGSTRYFCAGANVDFSDKDTKIKALKYFVTELGELGSTMKRDIDKLKAFITDPFDEIRVPYAKQPPHNPRMTSFCGSVNDEHFLIDPTGSRRFWVIPVNGFINNDILKTIDTMQLYKQIDQEAKGNLHGFHLTREEMKELQMRNVIYDKPIKLEVEVADILHHCEKLGYPLVEQSITDWKEQFSALEKGDSAAIGRVLSKMGYAPTRTNKSRARLLPKRPDKASYPEKTSS